MESNIFNFVKGIDTYQILKEVSSFVGSTLGPNGGYIVIGNDKNVHTTKDGVSCARLIKSKDTFINNIISIIKESSENVLREAGDGTTSTLLIAERLMYILKSNNLNITEKDVRDKISSMLSALNDIKRQATEEDLKKIIFTAVSGDEELADVVFEAFKNSLNGTNIVTKTTIGGKTTAEEINGFYINGKIGSETFNSASKIEDPYLIGYAGTIETEREVVMFIDKALEKGINNVVILCNGISEDALSVMSVNHIQGIINILPIVVSGGENINNIDLIKLISVATGCDITGQDFSMYLDDAEFKNINTVSKVYRDKKIFIFEGINTKNKDTNEIDRFIEMYNKRITEATDDIEKEMYSYFISILLNKMSVINISADIDNKIKELKDRVDDAISSIRTSLLYGVVEGAGKTYMKLNELTDNSELFKDVFNVIYKKIGTNYSKNVLDSSKVIESVLKTSSELAILLHNTKGVIKV